MAQPSGWYTDPTGRHTYRFWDGASWSTQVSDGGVAATDPLEIDATVMATSPAPGSQAPAPAPPPTPTEQVAPTVQVTQKSGGAGVLVGVLIGIVLIAAIIFFIVNSGGDSPTSTTVPETTTTAGS